MTKEELTARVAARFEEIKKLQDHESFYDYEKEFERIWLDLGREVLEQSLGDVPEERRKKKESRPGSAP